MKRDHDILPVLAVTMGDPSGIGPEIAVKVFSRETVYRDYRPLVIGNADQIAAAIGLCGSDIRVRTIRQPEEAKFQYGTIDLIDLPVAHPERIRAGEISAESGDIAFRSVVEGIELARSKRVDAVVTCPLHKEAMNLAGHHFSGHTEIFAHYTGSDKYAMLLADERIRIIHVTTHVSLRNACDLIKKKRIIEVIRLMDDALKSLGIERPQIGVAGLNPHSSDGGLFGDEEEKEIIPAIKEAVSEGIHASGPVPPDTLFALANGGRFDGCVAMYHDQGHIPFKLMGFRWDEARQVMKSVTGVNITLGLPIIRTSVDHGTAFEIAGKGIASPDALFMAMEYAKTLYLNRNR